MQKSVGRLEERLRKAEKKEAKAHGSSQADVSTVSRQVQGERLYEEERNRNEVAMSLAMSMEIHEICCEFAVIATSDY